MNVMNISFNIDTKCFSISLIAVIPVVRVPTS